MAIDLKKLVQTSLNKGFANNKLYTGSVGISGTVSAGLNIKTFVIPLEQAPDLISAIFNGPTDNLFGLDPRPNGGWFKKGAVYSIGVDGFGSYTVPWTIELTISGKNAIIKLSYVQQFVSTLTLDSITLNYRILDYSVF